MEVRFMAKKEVMVGFKTTLKEKEELYKEASELGFLKGGGKPNFSSFCRAIFKINKKPLCREIYADLIEINMNLLKLGSNLNQLNYSINRENFILNDKGLHNENNKLLLSQLGYVKSQINDLQTGLNPMKKIMQEIVNTEGA